MTRLFYQVVLVTATLLQVNRVQCYPTGGDYSASSQSYTTNIKASTATQQNNSAQAEYIASSYSPNQEGPKISLLEYMKSTKPDVGKYIRNQNECHKGIEDMAEKYNEMIVYITKQAESWTFGQKIMLEALANSTYIVTDVMERTQTTAQASQRIIQVMEDSCKNPYSMNIFLKFYTEQAEKLQNQCFLYLASMKELIECILECTKSITDNVKAYEKAKQEQYDVTYDQLLEVWQKELDRITMMGKQIYDVIKEAQIEWEELIKSSEDNGVDKIEELDKIAGFMTGGWQQLSPSTMEDQVTKMYKGMSAVVSFLLHISGIDVKLVLKSTNNAMEKLFAIIKGP